MALQWYKYMRVHIIAVLNVYLDLANILIGARNVRRINSIEDAQIVIRDIQDRLGAIESKTQNAHGRRITGLGAAVNPDDAVTLAQLPTLVPNAPQLEQPQNFQIVWNPTDASITDNTILIPRYIVGKFRVGMPIGVYAYAEGKPTTADMQIDILHNVNPALDDGNHSAGQQDAHELSWLKNNPLVIKQNHNGPVVTNQLNNVVDVNGAAVMGRPILAYLNTLRIKIIKAGGATGLTVGVEVLRMVKRV